MFKYIIGKFSCSRKYPSSPNPTQIILPEKQIGFHWPRSWFQYGWISSLSKITTLQMYDQYNFTFKLQPYWSLILFLAWRGTGQRWKLQNRDYCQQFRRRPEIKLKKILYNMDHTYHMVHTSHTICDIWHDPFKACHMGHVPLPDLVFKLQPWNGSSSKSHDFNNFILW